MPASTILVYGAEWCSDCLRARRFFTQNNIPFEWINIDRDKEGEQFVLQTNRGLRSIPTIVFPDGTLLVEPSTAQLRQKLAVAA
jgi:glutaredoxin